MNKKTFMIQAVLSACCIITSCSSDTVNGDNEYFTRGQITYVQEDENKIFFFDNQDGTAMVTYNRKYPIQLNDNNQAKLTTYAGEVTIPETFAVEAKLTGLPAWMRWLLPTIPCLPNSHFLKPLLSSDKVHLPTVLR
jgi:hypothetical protein